MTRMSVDDGAMLLLHPWQYAGKICSSCIAHVENCGRLAPILRCVCLFLVEGVLCVYIGCFGSARVAARGFLRHRGVEEVIYRMLSKRLFGAPDAGG